MIKREDVKVGAKVVHGDGPTKTIVEVVEDHARFDRSPYVKYDTGGWDTINAVVTHYTLVSPAPPPDPLPGLLKDIARQERCIKKQLDISKRLRAVHDRAQAERSRLLNEVAKLATERNPS